MDTINPNSSAFSHFIGVDVGKFTLAVHNSQTGESRTIDNTQKEIRSYLKTIKPSPKTLVICEASGGYEGELLACTLALGVAAHRANARNVKSFIASFGRLAKTDPGDAISIAEYGKERHERLALWNQQSPDQLELQALVLRRDDLVAIRVCEQNRLQAPRTAHPKGRFIARSCEAIIKVLKREIARIEKSIEKLVKGNDEIGRKYNILIEMKGIGPISAVAIIAHMPELGTCTRRTAASLAGLAPHPKDSGTTRGYRNVRGGRRPLKKALFMPAMVAARGNSELSVFYQKLRAKGKKPLVAITAIMRKLIIIANAKIRDMYLMQQS